MSALPARAPKPGLHPRNRHRGGYDFPALVHASPELAAFVRPSPAGTATIDFADPAAVTALNRALLRTDYGLADWEIPSGYLCPPVPGRADYVHHLADLLSAGGPLPRGSAVRLLDVGVGANCIYPIIGVRDYGWSFVGTDIDPVALAAAQKIVAANPVLTGKIELRLQRDPFGVFRGVTAPGESFTAALCNPPFHASAAEAAAGTARKVRNLHGAKASRSSPVLNFGGQSHELWCTGGESAFIRRMIAESVERPGLCQWFTTLVAKRESLPPIYAALEHARATEVRTIDVAQGQKQTRIVAWHFRPRRK